MYLWVRMLRSCTWGDFCVVHTPAQAVHMWQAQDNKNWCKDDSVPKSINVKYSFLQQIWYFGAFLFYCPNQCLFLFIASLQCWYKYEQVERFLSLSLVKCRKTFAMSFNIYKKYNNTVSIHLPVKILACEKEERRRGSWKCYKRG